MSSKKTTKVDVTYRNGFMVGRMVTIDESEGFDVPVPGCDVRIRVEAIFSYVYGAPHCILVSFGVEEESIQVWGTMEAMDDVIARDRLNAAPVVRDGAFNGNLKDGSDPSLRLVPVVDPNERA